jgi:hypothetical protein
MKISVDVTIIPLCSAINARIVSAFRGGDTITAGRPRVKPGDAIWCMPACISTFRNTTRAIARSTTTPFEETRYLTASGTPEKPIVINGAGDGEVISMATGTTISSMFINDAEISKPFERYPDTPTGLLGFLPVEFRHFVGVFGDLVTQKLPPDMRPAAKRDSAANAPRNDCRGRSSRQRKICCVPRR